MSETPPDPDAELQTGSTDSKVRTHGPTAWFYRARRRNAARADHFVISVRCIKGQSLTFCLASHA